MICLVAGQAVSRSVVFHVYLEGVAGKHGTTFAVVQDRVSFIVPACVVEGQARPDFELRVVGTGDPHGFGPCEIVFMYQHLWREAVLQLPQRAVAVRMRRGQDTHAAELLDLRQLCGVVERGALESHVAVRICQQPTMTVQAEARCGPELPYARNGLTPMERQTRFQLRGGHEIPAIFGEIVAHVRADGAVRRDGEIALPMAAIAASERFKRHARDFPPPDAGPVRPIP